MGRDSHGLSSFFFKRPAVNKVKAGHFAEKRDISGQPGFILPQPSLDFFGKLLLLAHTIGYKILDDSPNTLAFLYLHFPHW